MSRILIASGGTGGHFYPGFSLGLALRARGHEVLFLVRREDPALPLLESADLPALPLDLIGMPRRPGLRAAAFVWKLGGAFAVLRRAFAAWRPDAVVGMGAYVSFPAVGTAWARGVPALIHESNAVLGLANRLCVPLARRVCLGLPLEGGGSRAVLTGTPIREALWREVEAGAARLGLGLERERRTVLVFGGSQGAGAINAAAPAALAQAADALPGGLQVLHLAGAREQEAVARSYRERELPAVVLPYLESMELAFAAADLVLSRAGASTLAELIALRKPALLIPYPRAAAGHQDRNARLLETRGCAEVIREPDLTENRLAGRVAALLGGTGERLAAMRRACAGLEVPTGKAAAERLVETVEGMLTDGVRGPGSGVGGP